MIASKIDSLKKKLYFKKLHVLFNKAVNDGKITRFDDEIFAKMSGTIIACLPVSLYIKYGNYLFDNGTCRERSLFMFLALADALLVRGDKKDLEYTYGEGHGGHGWIELGNYVYDPAVMLRFDKDTYYALYECSNVSKDDKDTYYQQHKEFIDEHVTQDFDEFKQNGKRRLELDIIVKQIMVLMKYLDDEQFNKDVSEYLALVEYDEELIEQERKDVIEKILAKNFAVVSAREDK